MKYTMWQQSKDLVRLFKRELRIYQSVLADSRTPIQAKIFLGLAVGYLCMPFDLIPGFIPVIGHLDDVIIVPSPTPETGVLPGVSSSALSISSAFVSERFLNSLNFARQFPEKDVEEARGRCRIHGIRFDFFDIPLNFSGIPVSARLRKEPDALLSMRMKS